MWEKEKLLVTSNFSFSHIVFKRHVLQTRKNQGLFGKGLAPFRSGHGLSVLFKTNIACWEDLPHKLIGSFQDKYCMLGRFTAQAYRFFSRQILHAGKIYRTSLSVLFKTNIACWEDLPHKLIGSLQDKYCMLGRFTTQASSQFML